MDNEQFFRELVKLCVCVCKPIQTLSSPIQKKVLKKDEHIGKKNYIEQTCHKLLFF